MVDCSVLVSLSINDKSAFLGEVEVLIEFSAAQMTPMFLEVTEQSDVQSSPVPMQDRVHRQNQSTVIVQGNKTSSESWGLSHRL